MTNEMNKEFEEAMMKYIIYLDKQSPYISDSHKMLIGLCDYYGLASVNNWLEKFYGKGNLNDV